MAANPTPFDSYFAGPGFVYPGEGVGGAIVNITTRFPFHLLDPGLVQRKIIVIDGVYYIETIGIGEGALGKINENETALELAWGFGAGVTLKKQAFQLIIEGYVPKCFPATTAIQTSLTSTTPISALRIGDTVLSFDPAADLGRGALVPRRVTRLFRNSTSEWIKLTWVDPVSGEAQELVATPGHNMLDKHGRFTPLDALVAGNACEIILSSGDCIMAQAERLVYSAATADMFERATAMTATSGALAIAPHALDAWATYNFEVEDLHTYVAGGVRVHNDSLFGPVSDLGRLGDNVASQISDFAFGRNTLGSAFAGSALRSVASTAADAIKGQASFDPYHLTGRYIYDLAGGLGNLGGNLLMQDALLKKALISASDYNFHLQHAKAHAKNINEQLTTHGAGAFWFTQTLAA